MKDQTVDKRPTEFVLQALLQDHAFVTNQMHTRMGIVARLISASVQFYAATVGVVLLHLSKIISGEFQPLFIGASIPFFIIAMLIAREDFLMMSHDAYYLRLREDILNIIGLESNSRALTFLGKINKYKVGRISMIASVFRYFFPLLGIVTLGYAGYEISGEWQTLLTLFCAILIILILIALVAIGFKNGRVYNEPYEKKGL